MPNNAKHSPLPWVIGTAVPDTVFDADHRGVASCARLLNDEANAALIVRAVNSHADLLAALEWAMGTIQPPIHDGENGNPLSSYGAEYAAARAAIAKAKGEA